MKLELRQTERVWAEWEVYTCTHHGDDWCEHFSHPSLRWKVRTESGHLLMDMSECAIKWCGAMGIGDDCPVTALVKKHPKWSSSPPPRGA